MQKKVVKDIGGNQELLLAAINQYISSNTITLLYGHFCLLGSTSKVTRISQQTFDNISTIAIIVLYDTITNISINISSRDGVQYDSG